jgi:hypothetical protein
MGDHLSDRLLRLASCSTSAVLLRHAANHLAAEQPLSHLPEPPSERPVLTQTMPETDNQDIETADAQPACDATDAATCYATRPAGDTSNHTPTGAGCSDSGVMNTHADASPILTSATVTSGRSMKSRIVADWFASVPVPRFRKNLAARRRPLAAVIVLCLMAVVWSHDDRQPGTPAPGQLLPDNLLSEFDAATSGQREPAEPIVETRYSAPVDIAAPAADAFASSTAAASRDGDSSTAGFSPRTPSTNPGNATATASWPDSTPASSPAGNNTATGSGRAIRFSGRISPAR